jgi:hypothetical protein
MDGDLSHRPEELPTGTGILWSGKADVAIASKYWEGSRVINRPVGRLLVSHISSIAVGLLINRSLRDYSNGYRFYTRAAAELAAGHSYRYGSPIYLSEILALWKYHDLRIVEFTTTYVGRNEGISKLRIADLIKAAIGVFEIAYRYHFQGFTRQPPDPVVKSAASLGCEAPQK